MLKMAEEKVRDKGYHIPLTQGDFRELSRHYSSAFDCVMSTGSALAHVSNADVVLTLKEMDKLIKPGGYLYFDSRNWDVELKNKKRFKWTPPFIGQDGIRINCVQDWDYHTDGTISINILHSYERDNRIFDSNDFAEHLTPFSLDIVYAVLTELGYSQPVVKPCPWFEDKPLEDISWYCLIAESPYRNLKRKDGYK